MQRNYRQITPTHTTRTSKAGNSANTQEKGGVANPTATKHTTGIEKRTIGEHDRRMLNLL